MWMWMMCGTKTCMGVACDTYSKNQAERKKSIKNEKKLAAEFREQLVIAALTPYLYSEYTACKDYPKMCKYEELTKAAIVALNSRDITGMNRWVKQGIRAYLFLEGGILYSLLLVCLV